jgi:high-affinity iron transporter
MIPTAIVVFREVLEAALIIAIVLAATKTIARRSLWVTGGTIAGVVGAALVAAFAGLLDELLAGISQEVFNASVLFIAVVMLAWHNVWMGRHGRELAAEAAAVGRAIVEGARPLYALAIVVGLAVLREGSEAVLFVYGIALSDKSSVAEIAGGTFIGLAGGAALGAALYLGLLRVPMRHLFSVTTVMLVLLAAGMAAQGAGFLLQADLVPALGYEVWDTSAILPDDNFLARLLHILIGYTAQPAGIQVLVYVVTIAAIAMMMRLWGRVDAQPTDARAPRPAA